MTIDQAKAMLAAAISEVAPEVEGLDGLDPDASLRETVDLDSMDFLAVVSSLARQAGIDIPEEDFVRLETLSSAVDYLVGRTA